ncbi:hypothetical protein [Aquitalea denitrificans]|nr:hypothetical protein [Aquitalea denitrificans]
MASASQKVAQLASGCHVDEYGWQQATTAGRQQGDEQAGQAGQKQRPVQ